MAFNFLKTDVIDGKIGVLTISAPKSLNALNTMVLNELNTYLNELDNAIRVLIITGDGDKSFVAGADISEMQHMNSTQALAFAQLGASVFRRIETLSIPVIAAVNGYALGGGCELAMACDIRIASENARLGQPEVKLGIIPGFSGTYRLTKLVGEGMAKEMIYTAKNIKAAEALQIGLVNSVVAHSELMNSAIAMAKKISENAPIAISNAKQSINGGYGLSADEFIALENKLFASCFDTQDQKEGMSAFLESRAVKFENK